MNAGKPDISVSPAFTRASGEVSGEKSGATLRRRRGKFAYRTTLPSDADAEKIDAQLADDILTVRLPKGPRPSPARSRSSPNEAWCLPRRC